MRGGRCELELHSEEMRRANVIEAEPAITSEVQALQLVQVVDDFGHGVLHDGDGGRRAQVAVDADDVVLQRSHNRGKHAHLFLVRLLERSRSHAAYNGVPRKFEHDSRSAPSISIRDSTTCRS